MVAFKYCHLPPSPVFTDEDRLKTGLSKTKQKWKKKKKNQKWNEREKHPFKIYKWNEFLNKTKILEMRWKGTKINKG